jgi:hypothetical protein
MEYHVAKNGSDQNIGTDQNPFLTINKAASIAVAGDTVTVHEGIYREWVKPKYKGLSDKRRIVYQAAEGEQVTIKGSEELHTWELVEGNVWKVILPNTFFGEFNPYKEELYGDWVVTIEEIKHLGEVYLNGMSFYEVSNYEQLKNPSGKKEVLDYWRKEMVPVLNEEQTKYVWFSEVDADNTTIYANFNGVNPNNELVEINVRRSCFYPDATGIDYITVKGFEMAQAASPWAPPTADQPGLLGPNWSKGWIIENNLIHDAKCSAVSLGKEANTGHNYRTIRKDKPGYQYQLEAVFTAEHNGWSKEKIGSHIVRNNTIHDCGQNAIVGHLGCVFSEIHHNHIYNIDRKREMYGYEIAGIKFHAAIDVYIHHNKIHDCSLGIWSDWETQGTRISKNLFYNNNRDLFVEVSHGPYVVDNNILTSDYAMDNFSQGGAYVNNLICGKLRQDKVLDRATQYHLPHSTKVAGFACIYGGDDRFYNNVFVGTEGLKGVGTSHYNNYTTSLEEYIEEVHKTHGDLEVYQPIEQPVYIDNNAYFNGAEAFAKEKSKLVDDFNPKVSIKVDGDKVYLSCEMPKSFEDIQGKIHSTATLPRVRIVDAEFERADGSNLILDTDYLDEVRSEKSALGPIANLKSGMNHIRVW